MGYVATPAELERFRAGADFARGIAYAAECLSISFTTTEAFVRSVLPPCFEPAAQPTGVASVGSYRKHLDGQPGGAPGMAFGNAVVGVHARCGEVEGLYALTMLVTGDMPITIGRETTGEPKKRGRVELDNAGDRCRGRGERHGTRLIEIEAQLEAGGRPADAAFANLELKACLGPDGASLQYDPLVIALRGTERWERLRTGPGRLRLAGTAVDPLDTIPLVLVGEAAHGVGSVAIAAEVLARLPADAAYLPYVVGRSYDNAALWADRDARRAID